MTMINIKYDHVFDVYRTVNQVLVSLIPPMRLWFGPVWDGLGWFGTVWDGLGRDVAYLEMRLGMWRGVASRRYLGVCLAVSTGSRDPVAPGLCVNESDEMPLDVQEGRRKWRPLS